MKDLVRKSGFLPEATWLLAATRNNRRTPEYCGTIQGIRDSNGLGSIQNVVVARGHRDCGLGTCLLARSLAGFRTAGIDCVYLEATAQNDGAIRLYRRLGFTRVKTVFKAVSES
jgi:mycothiol synthase